MTHGEIRWFTFSYPNKKRPVLILTRSSIIKMLNNEAITSLNANQFEKTLLLIMKCDALTQIHKFGIFTSLKALTYNSFGCYFRRINDLVISKY